MTLPGSDAGPAAAHVSPRAVPWQQSFAWYGEALRLFRVRTGVWVAFAAASLLTELAFQALPGYVSFPGKLIAPLIACGMLAAAAAADRGDPPGLRLLFAAFRRPPAAIAAIVVASLVTTFAEVFAGWWIADANLLTGAGISELTGAAVLGIYAIGMLVSLPVSFVPLHMLFERVTPGQAFAASFRAFLENPGPLAVYSLVLLVLLAIALATMGFGLLVVLPLAAASSYAAWRDIFAVAAPPSESAG